MTAIPTARHFVDDLRAALGVTETQTRPRETSTRPSRADRRSGSSSSSRWWRRRVRPGISGRGDSQRQPISRPRRDLALRIGRGFADRGRLPERGARRPSSPDCLRLYTACRKVPMDVHRPRCTGPFERRLRAHSKSGANIDPPFQADGGRKHTVTTSFRGCAEHVQEGDCSTSKQAMGNKERGQRRDGVLRRHADRRRLPVLVLRSTVMSL